MKIGQVVEASDDSLACVHTTARRFPTIRSAEILTPQRFFSRALSSHVHDRVCLRRLGFTILKPGGESSPLAFGVLREARDLSTAARTIFPTTSLHGPEKRQIGVDDRAIHLDAALRARVRADGTDDLVRVQRLHQACAFGRRIARVVCSLLVIAQVLSASFLWRPRRRESVRLVTSGDRVHDAGGVRSCRKVSTLLSCQSVSLAGSSRLF